MINSRFWKFSLLVCCLGVCSACGSSSPSVAPTPVYPSAQGIYRGSATVRSCVDGVGLAGFCSGSSFIPNNVIDVTLNIAQSQSQLTGTLTLGSLSGQFQGFISTNGAVSATAAITPVSILGLIYTTNVSAWNTTVTGNSMSGSFTTDFRVSGASGTTTMNTTVLLTR